MAVDVDEICGKVADTKEELLNNKKTGKVARLVEQEQRLLRAIIVLVILMNIPWGRYILYPFMLFSTWVHEMCHGLAAIMVGGRFLSLKVYKDGSGVAYSSISGNGWYSMKRAIVASAGYTGTALVGGILLLFRRTRRGPKNGLMGIGTVMLLSCLFKIRNGFGLLVFIPMGVALILCGWKLEAGQGLGTIYAFVAATCCLNALTSINYLFNTSEGYVGGQPRDSDAQTVAKYLGFTYWFWAIQWFVFSIVMLAVGLIFAVEPSEATDPTY